MIIVVKGAWEVGAFPQGVWEGFGFRLISVDVMGIPSSRDNEYRNLIIIQERPEGLGKLVVKREGL